jgi:ATP-binding cassette subfamily B protein
VKKQKKKRDNGAVKRFGKLVQEYAGWAFLLLVFIFATNGLNLAIPQLIGDGVDAFQENGRIDESFILIIGFVLIGVFIARAIESLLSILIAERMAARLRKRLARKISKQSFAYINKISQAKLLTNFTSDVEQVKTIISQGIVQLISSFFLIIGSAALMIRINWKLALLALSIIPLIVIGFQVIFKRIGKLFKQSREVLDKLNKVVSESIVGAAMVRIVDSVVLEKNKFSVVNKEAKDVGIRILSFFGSLIPFINLLSSLGIVIIVWFGGNDVIRGDLTIGEFTAFYGYLTGLITPIFILGFISNALLRAWVAFVRVDEVLHAKLPKDTKGKKHTFSGKLEFKNVSLTLKNTPVLKNISFTIEPGTKNALIGPTAAGKTQIFYLITGLRKPTKGEILFDGVPIDQLDTEYLYSQIGFVFQDNIIFNASVLENIVFNDAIQKEDVERAVAVAELDDFIKALPEKEHTIVSERGESLSGGQKQRLSLARALALNPKLLLLDDFTSRVDISTEKRIAENLKTHYQDTTQLVISQKIDSVKEYDQIILIMSGEMIAQGTHDVLLKESFEYEQMYESQKSTEE